MTIKIWHQSFTVLSDLGDYNAALKSHFAQVAKPTTQIDIHGMAVGTYPSHYPGDDIKYCGYQYLHGLQFLLNGLRAQAEGYDAYAISTLPEPSLWETRSLLDIPVVGYAESAMLDARERGLRFGFLVFIDELAELVTANAVKYGLGDYCVGAWSAGFTFSDILSGFQNPGRLIERFYISARKLIDSGATAIIPGEAPLNVLLAREGVSDVDGVPVIDSLSCWIKRAEANVLAKRQGASVPPTCGYYTAHPTLNRTEEIIRFYGLDSFVAKQEWT